MRMDCFIIPDLFEQTEMTRYSSEFYGYDSDRARSHSPPSDFGPRSDISNDSIEKDPAARFERQQRRWLAELKARNAKIVQVTYPRTANNDKELTVVRGEYLEVSNDPLFSFPPAFGFHSLFDDPSTGAG